VPREQLRAWIDEEVGLLDWNNPELLAHLRKNPRYQPRKLLCLLTYAYATAVYESDEILQRCRTEPQMRAILGDHVIEFPRTLSLFRRENRGLLKWSLFQVFKRAFKARMGEALLPAGLKRPLLNAASARLDVARQMDRGPMTY
jgi:transposase